MPNKNISLIFYIKIQQEQQQKKRCKYFFIKIKFLFVFFWPNNQLYISQSCL